MDLALAAYALVSWGTLAVFAIVNGIFRQTVLVKKLGQGAARSVSSVTLSAIIFALAYVMLCFAPGDYGGIDLWFVGTLWLTLTVLFEFGFGHFFMKRSWAVLLEDYNVLKGRIWIVVLLVTFVAPYLMGSAAQGRWL
jgi:hypothetical protein